MLGIIFVGLVIVVVCVFPVMLTARKLDAGKSDLVDCIIAIVVGVFISSIAVGILPGDLNPLLVIVCWFVVTGFVYKIMLETTLVAGVVIAIVPAVFNLVLTSIFK